MCLWGDWGIFLTREYAERNIMPVSGPGARNRHLGPRDRPNFSERWRDRTMGRG